MLFMFHRSAHEVPSYAKWGQVAMQKTKEKYPQAEITDYLHIGREQGPELSTEKFKFWLLTANKEFGVFVDITFKNDTEQIIDIQFRETMRGNSFLLCHHPK